MLLRHTGAAAAALMLCAQPCVAAAGAGEQRSAAFAGLSLRMPMGAAKREKPTARLQLTATRSVIDTHSASVRTYRAAGLELGASRTGKPDLYLAGQSSAEIEKRLGVNGSTGTTVLIAGGVLVLLVLVAVASAAPTPGPREGAFD